MSLRASAGYVGGRAVAGGLSLVAMALFARGLGPEGYARYALAATAAAFTVAVLLQPVQQALGRFLPRDPEVAPAFARLMSWLVAALALAAVVVELALHLLWPPLTGLAVAALALGVSQGVFDFSAQHASASLQPGRYALLYVLKAVLLVGAAVLLWSAGLGSGFAVAFVCLASLLAVLLGGRPAWVGPPGARLDGELGRRVKTFCVPLAVSMLVSNALQWLDRFVLAAAAAPLELGAYAAVGDLAQQSLGFLFGSLYLAWYPRMVVAHEGAAGEERGRLAGRYATLGLAVLLPATLGFGVLGEALAHVFFGAAYAETAARLWWPVSLAVALAGLRMYFFDIGLYLTNRMGLQLRNVSVAALLVLLLDLWWVPVHGAAGAAWAAVVAQALGLALSAWSARAVVGWQLPWRQVWPVLLACATMVLVVLNVQGTGLGPLVLRIGLGVLTYGLAMLALDGAGCRTWLRDTRRARAGG